MSDFSMPGDYPTIPSAVYDEIKLVKLAREIAMGIRDLPEILFANDLTLHEFEFIKESARFKQLLEGEVKDWAQMGTTPERLKIKATAMLEEYLPELYARLNDRNEPLLAKIKALEHIAKLAGIGGSGGPADFKPGDRVVVTINLGADTKLEYQKRLPPQVIEHEPTPEPSPTFEESLDASAYSV